LSALGRQAFDLMEGAFGFWLLAFLIVSSVLISGEICFFALHNIKRWPYKVNPLPYFVRFFRKPLTAAHISQILRKASV